MVNHPLLREESIVYSGQWEPIAFRKQNGNNHENIESSYAFETSEPFVKHLASLGVNQLWTRFFKGYGMAFEDAEQQKLRGLAERCHRHGIRVFAYCTFGTLALDALLAEKPGAGDWVAKPDIFAHAAYSGYQCFRARVDYTSTEWLAYMVRVVDKALDMGADGIHFDNAEMSIGFEACRCERCTHLFRAFLAERYGMRTIATRRAGQARYGTNDFSKATPPWFTLGQHPVNQRQIRVPLQQDWVQFRCDTFTAALRSLSTHIRARGRMVESNLGKNENTNNPYYRGLDYERVFPLVDCAFHEDLDRPGFNRHDSPVCALRSFKVADAFGLPLMVYARSSLELAESFALNPGASGLATPFMDEDRRRQFDFIRRWANYNSKSESLAQVAVLRHRLSMAYDSYDSVMAAVACEQVLQENQIPFDILAASQLDRLSRYHVLVIPAMRWMRDEEGRTISRWVRAGGRLFLVGEVGIRNELNQIRSAVKSIRTLEDFRLASEVKPLFSPLVRRAFDAPCSVKAGKGRVAWMPSFDHPDQPGHDLADWRVERDHINMPCNASDVLAIFRTLLAGREKLHVEAPRHVVVEFRRRADTGEEILHFLNLGWTREIESNARIVFRREDPRPRVTVLQWGTALPPLKTPLRRKGPYDVVDITGIREHAMMIIARSANPAGNM